MAHHRRGLRRLLRNDPLVSEIESQLGESPSLDPRRREMVRYAEKLTRDPKSMQKADLDRLRSVEFSDRDILHIAEVTAYYAYVNRIADGLGVELEAEKPAE